MYYILENSSNVERRENGKSSQFWDDCGAWKNAKTPVTHFLSRNDRLRTVVKNSNGLYCTERQINKKRVFIPIEPQPDDNEILELHRLYQNLVASQGSGSEFKRRFAWIAKVPINMPAIPTNIAVVEYIGEFPKRLMHGNVKKQENNTVYVRTKDSVMSDLKNQLKYDTVKTVARHMNLTTKDDFEKQRNDKQLRNLKHSISRAQKDQSGTNNAADHVICVEEMTKSHPFVKTVKHISGINFPVVTLYTDQQIADIKRFCCKEGGTVLGMDKTFNLGEFHVTPTVYKDLSVVRRERNDGNPICIGPTHRLGSLLVSLLVPTIYVKLYMSCVARKLAFGFQTRCDTNRARHKHKIWLYRK